MSINRPGLPKSSQAILFKKKASKTTLSSAYTNGTVANPRSSASVNLTNMQKGTSVFMSNGAQVYLNPGRSLRNVNPYLVKNDNSALRAALNSNNGYDIADMKYMEKLWAANQGEALNNNNDISKYEALTLATGIMSKLFESLGEIKGTETKDNSNNSNNANIASNLVNSIANMLNANDSATLSAAIDSAKAKKESLPTEITNAEERLSELSGQTKNLKQNSETANKNLQDNKDAIINTSGEVNKQRQTVSSCQIALDSLEMQYNEFNIYNNTETKIMLELRNKITKLEKKLKAEQEKLNTLENELTTLNNETAGLKDAATNAQNAFDKNSEEIETTTQKIKDLKEEQTKLETELPKQEARLKKLQEK